MAALTGEAIRHYLGEEETGRRGTVRRGSLFNPRQLLRKELRGTTANPFMIMAHVRIANLVDSLGFKMLAHVAHVFSG